MAAEIVYYLIVSLGAIAAWAMMLGWVRLRFGSNAFFPGKESISALVLVAGALLAVAPLLRPVAVGSGDAYHYGLQAADFVTQVRAGVFPVLVGQSDYGFNGNIHTLRTAPYFVHLCGLMDFVSFGRLSAFRLAALAAIASALGGALTAWASARAFGPNERLRSALLAVLYVTAPGVGGALFGRDMYATFMTLPWIPLVILGAAQCAGRDRPIAPLMLLAGALALVWYAHPPTGALLTPLAFLAVAARLVRGPHRINLLTATTPIAVGFLLISAYLFYSVRSMELAYRTGAMAETGQSIVNGLQGLWPGLLEPIHAHGGSSSDMQPGYCVLALAGLALVLARRARFMLLFLSATFAGYLLLIIPNPLTAWLWLKVPVAVVAVINPDPFQRILPILTALAVVSGAAALVWLRPTRRSAVLVPTLLVVGVAWNLFELSHFWPAPQPDADGDRLIRENVSLTRSSYLLFGQFPRTFSNGAMDPQQETRLVGADGAVVQSDSAAVTAGAPGAPWISLDHEQSIPIKAAHNYAVEFRFANPTAVGEVLVASGKLHRAYALPASGYEQAFGAGPAAAKVLFVRASDHDGKLLVLHSSVAGTTARVLPYDEATLPIRVTGLIPFTVQLRSPPGARFVEIPKMMIPGYEARVNGAPAPISRSPQGELRVPVPPGESTVTVTYPGPAHLRQLYWLSLASLLLWGVATALAYQWEGLPQPVARPARVIAITLTSGLIALIPLSVILRPQPPADHILRLSVSMPQTAQAASEPLVTLGRAGAADVIAIEYVGANQFQLVYDHWSKGGPKSRLMSYVPGQIMEFEFHLPGLIDPRAGERDRAVTRVAANGRNLLQGRLPWYQNSSQLLYLGRNPIGASTCSPAFSGGIRRVSFGGSLRATD